MSRRAKVDLVQRQLLILYVLNERRQPLRAADVRARIDDISRRNLGHAAYDTGAPTVVARESARRRWQRDLRMLRAQNYVLTGLPNPVNRQLEMIQAVDLSKPRSLWLSKDEHIALRAARVRHDDAFPPSNAPSRNARELDQAFRLMRLMEESFGPVDLQAFSRELGISAAEVRALLEVVRVAYNDKWSRIDFRWPEANRGADDEDRQGEDSLADYESAGFVYPVRNSSDAPLSGMGMSEVGRFAYSSEECQERIAILDWALTDATTPIAARARLRSARRKLDSWRRHFEHA